MVFDYRVSSHETWQRRRSRLNHDWLKNEFLPKLGKWINIVAGRVDDPGFEDRFIGETLPQWRQVRTEMAALIGSVEQEMSPAILLGRHPFSAQARVRLAWLGLLIHQMWSVRIGIDGQIVEAMASLECADRSYKAISVHLPAGTSGLQLRLAVEDFYRDCQALSESISRLPSRIAVV